MSISDRFWCWNSRLGAPGVAPVGAFPAAMRWLQHDGDGGAREERCIPTRCRFSNAPRRLFENRKPPLIGAAGVLTVVQVELSRHSDDVIRRKLDFSILEEYWTGERPPERGDRYLVNQES